MKVRFLIFNSPFLFSRTSDAIITGCWNPKKQPYLMRERIPNKNPPVRKSTLYSCSAVLHQPETSANLHTRTQSTRMRETHMQKNRDDGKIAELP